jgi:hypothetical protein
MPAYAIAARERARGGMVPTRVSEAEGMQHGLE